ncbi:MAG TPA: methionine aminotransferase [Flavitalea sp.]|nr:methionine aminotransferase [Flavitalea sp.]
MEIRSKLPDAGTTIFTTMSRMATEYQAVNLGQGFPDFSMDQELTELVSKAMKDNYNQYAPMPGWPPLLEAIAEKIQSLYGTKLDPLNEITITPGGSYAIYSALTTILQPGDEVIVMQPCYDSYVPNILVSGARPVFVNLKFPDYSIDWDAVENAITTRTRAIIINSPNNPAGSVLTAYDIESLRRLTAGTNIFIVADEVYEHLIYDDRPHLSMLLYPDLLERSFVCFSFGKLYHCTGWKIGYCVAPAKLTAEFRKIHQFDAFSVNTPGQVGLASFVSKKETYLGLSSFFQKKRDYFISLMKETRFSMLNSAGTYFICGSYERISDEPDREFAIRLTKEVGVTLIPVSAFYQSGKDNKVVRFCFGKNESTLEKAVERLMKV